MSEQLLRDVNIEPTKEVIAKCLGVANDAYNKFIEKLSAHDIEAEWRYYKDGNAWLGKGLYKWVTTRGTQKEKTVFWLSIWAGFFKVTIYIPEKYRVAALELPLSEDMKRMIENAKQIGKLKFFPLIFDVSSDKNFGDIFKLIDFRKSLK